MTREDYEMIAEVIDQHIRGYGDTSREIRRTVANVFADRLGAENPRFNVDKFLIACGAHE